MFGNGINGLVLELPYYGKHQYHLGCMLVWDGFMEGLVDITGKLKGAINWPHHFL